MDKKLKIAIVHDYIKEYGGAERVLEELTKLYPDAPIYTAFYKKGSPAYEKFCNKKIIPSWAHYIPFFATKLHSPLRFLAPLIWGSFDFSDYDVIISSSSWYVTKGFKKGNPSTRSGRAPLEICYCHTPPRWLYGYKTSIEWQKYWPIKLYGMIVGHFMRLYDFRAAQRVDFFIANSNEVKARIEKFYRRESTVIYPPVFLPSVPKVKKEDYYFVVARIVGGKGLDLAVEAAKRMNIKLKIAGVPAGYYTDYKALTKKSAENVEFLGYVTDEELVKLYAGAKAFFALSEDEDFGITPVESMLCGTPVIAYYGGGYKETVIDGKTGVFFKNYSVEGLIEAIEKFETLRQAQGKKIADDCVKQAQKFSVNEFDKKIKKLVEEQ